MMTLAFKFVVPANAGTHTPSPLGLARWQRPFAATSPVVMGPCVLRDDDNQGNI